MELVTMSNVPSQVIKYMDNNEYINKIKNIKNGQTKNIYRTQEVEIDVLKVNKKLYTIINHYKAEKTGTEAILDMIDAAAI